MCYLKLYNIDNWRTVIYNVGMSSKHIDEFDNLMTRVFFCKLLPSTKESVYPPQRQELIDKCRSERVRAEKYTSWKLLEYALKEVYDTDITKVQFYLGENGKWTCDKCYFSISHSDGIVAVAIDNQPVGIDIENMQNAKFTQKLANKILTDEEFLSFINNGEKALHLCQYWCNKEALFKKCGIGVFVPQNIQTEGINDNICSYIIHVDDKKFYLALANNTPLFQVIEAQL